jgi:hypothetical protein
MGNFNEVTKDLIYDLIFSEKLEYKIDVSYYIDDIYEHKDFINEIKKILEISKVNIVKSSINIDSKTVTWELKVNK